MNNVFYKMAEPPSFISSLKFRWFELCFTVNDYFAVLKIKWTVYETHIKWSGNISSPARHRLSLAAGKQPGCLATLWFNK